MTQVSSNVVGDAVESLDFAGARLSCPDFLFFPWLFPALSPFVSFNSSLVFPLMVMCAITSI